MSHADFGPAGPDDPQAVRPRRQRRRLVPGRTVQLHIGAEESFTPARKAHPALRVTGIRAYVEQIADCGAEVI
jgi:hypothetical protein